MSRRLARSDRHISEERRSARLDDLEKIPLARRRRGNDSRLWLASLQGIAWPYAGGSAGKPCGDLSSKLASCRSRDDDGLCGAGRLLPNRKSVGWGKGGA